MPNFRYPLYRLTANRYSYKQLTLVLSLALLLVGPAAVEPARAAIYHPRSSIDRPLGPGAQFLLGNLALSGTMSYDAVATGWGGSLLFRPLAAADFLGPFYDWNTGAVGQFTKQNVGEGREIVALEALGRRYLSDMRRSHTGQSLFVGAGIGALKAVHPGGRTKGFSWPVEFGWERSYESGWIVVAKAQFRYFKKGSLDYTGWSTNLAVGFPLPW